jgi:hypothetical protein
VRNGAFRRCWNSSECSVEDGGGRLRSRPGTILAYANACLRKYGRLDPQCRRHRCTSRARRLSHGRALTFALLSGTILNIENAHAEQRVGGRRHALRKELLAHKTLADRVTRKCAIGTLALLDGTPLQICARLLTGPERMLAFIAKPVIHTPPAQTRIAALLLDRQSTSCSAQLTEIASQLVSRRGSIGDAEPPAPEAWFTWTGRDEGHESGRSIANRPIPTSQLKESARGSIAHEPTSLPSSWIQTIAKERARRRVSHGVAQRASSVAYTTFV